MNKTIKQKILGLGLAAFLSGCSDRSSNDVSDVSFEGQIQRIEPSTAVLRSRLGSEVVAELNNNLPEYLKQSLRVGDVLRVQGCTATGAIQNDDYAFVRLQGCTHYYKH